MFTIIGFRNVVVIAFLVCLRNVRNVVFIVLGIVLMFVFRSVLLFVFKKLVLLFYVMHP
jgi:hypothetical protein